MTRIIKETKSLDARDGSVIPAKVIEDEGRVFMESRNGRLLIEKDAELYSLITCQPGQPERIQHLAIEPTYKCDLSCPFCFTDGQEEDFSFEEMRRSLGGYRGKIVSISGGEPTLREDLPEIVREVGRRNIALLATNGIKLADAAYVQSLKDAGLGHVVFSLNGFTEESLIGTNGVSLIGAKMKALENIERAGMGCVLSFLLRRGLNEHELPALFAYAYEHPALVREIRIRSTASVGKYAEHEQLFLSEILRIVCDSLGIAKSDVMKELMFQRRISHSVPFLHFSLRSCSLGFHLLRDKGGYVPGGSLLRPGRGIVGRARDVGVLLRLMSPAQLIANKLNIKQKSPWKQSGDVLKVVLRSWPERRTLDLLDHSRLCGTRYLIGKKAGKALCHANILRDIEQSA